MVKASQIASTKKTTTRVQSNSEPEMFHSDVLAVVLDEELSNIAERLEDERLSALKAGRVTRLYEEELAYIRREQQIRSLRRRAHASYISNLQQEIAMQDAIESALPNFDDRCNKEYVDAWWRWGN